MDDGFRDSDKYAGLPRDAQGADVGYGEDPIEDAASSGRLFWQRLVGVVRCSPAAFAEFAGDRRATWQIAVLVVAIVVINAIGADLSGLYSELAKFGLESQIPFYRALAVPLGIVFVAVWAGIVMLVAKLFSSESMSYGGWFRALGPISVTSVLQLIPHAGWILSNLYWIVLTFVAVRTVARVSRMATVGIIAIAWIGPFALLGLLAVLLIAVALTLA